MTALRTSWILLSDRCPAVDRIIFLSAVNILLGRIKLSIGSPPEMKSPADRDNARESDLDLLVIWHTIISSSGRSVITKAGRFLLPDRSLDGKESVIISPFTNLPMPHPLQVCPSLLTKKTHLIAWFLVFAKVCGVSAKPQNPQLRPNCSLEVILSHVIIQLVLSLFLSYSLIIAKKTTGTMGAVFPHPAYVLPHVKIEP